MTYNIGEYLDKTLRSIDLCPSVDFSLTLHVGAFGAERIDIMVFWHAPSLNVGWYPICQIDINDKTIFHRERSENPDNWNQLLVEAADFIKVCRP